MEAVEKGAAEIGPVEGGPQIDAGAHPLFDGGVGGGSLMVYKG